MTPVARSGAVPSLGRLPGAWRRVFSIVAGLALLGGAALVSGILINNSSRAAPSESELRTALGRALGWMAAHRADVLAEPPNHVLWWMLAKADERVGGDPRLESSIQAYLERWSKPRSPGVLVLRLLFARQLARPLVPASTADGLRPDNVMTLYALTCSPELARLPVVQKQLRSDNCPAVWPVWPHCATHQLMGVLWAFDSGCQGIPTTLAAALQGTIRRQLVLDFRVDESYIQRALMLAASAGGCAPIKPVWIARVLEHQLPDGGWDYDYPVLRLSASRFLVIGSHGLSIRPPQSQLHATAQSILLLSYLLAPGSINQRSSVLAHWAQPPAGCLGP